MDVGSNNLITRTALVPGTALGKGTIPNIPPEPLLSSSSSAPTHPKVLENCLFPPSFPSFHLYQHREREKRDLSPLPKPLGAASTWAKAAGGFPCSFGKDELDSGRITTRVFIPRVS